MTRRHETGGIKSQKGASLTPSVEDYLEAIYNLEGARRVARVKDIAGWLAIKMPSVSEVLVGLTRQGFIKHEKGGYVQLTESGRQIAKRVQQRHSDLISFLKDVLAVNEKIAVRDACYMEHIISPMTMSRINQFVGFINHCHNRPTDWRKGFEEYCKRYH